MPRSLALAQVSTRNDSYINPRLRAVLTRSLQQAKMKSIGTKMTTRLRQHQLPLPMQLVVKAKSQTLLLYRIRKPIPILRRQQI